MVKRMNVKVKNGANIYLIGDTHVGSKNFDKEALKKTVNIIKKDKKAAVFFMGDAAEFILPDDKRFDIENIDPENLTAERQYSTLRNILMPIKDKIKGILEGNHDFTQKKKSGFDVPHILSHDFNAKYLGSSGLIRFSNGIRMFISHGNGSGTTLASSIRKVLQMASNFKIKPDIVGMGHTHALQILNNAHLGDDFNVGVDILALTGSYYKTYIDGEENYGSRRVFAPLVCGCIKINMDKVGNLRGETLIFE